MTSNPKALDHAQDDSEPFQVMESPPRDFDMFTSQPISTGVVKCRKQVHQQKDWHSSVHIWIVDVERRLLLLQLRSKAKDTFPGRWDISSAGHIPAKATALATARAELEEELGIAVAAVDEFEFQFICPAEQASLGGCNCYEHVFFLKQDSSTLKCALGTAEVTDSTWVSIPDLKAVWECNDEAYVPRVQIYREIFFQCLDRILVPKQQG
jgi:isopentenyldiphosphate isomerase